MPIAAIAAGIGGAATLATVGAAAMTTFEVIAAVGAIAGAVGVVTKSKELTALGGIAALAGGVGAFAQNQGWLATADAANTAALGGAGAVSNTQTAINTPTAGVEQVSPAMGAGAENMTAGLPDGGSVVQDAIRQGTDLAGAGDAGLMYAGQDANAAASIGQRGLIDASPLQNGATLTKAALDGTNAFGANSAPGAFNLAGAPKSGSIFDSIKNLFFDKDGKENKTMLSLAGNFVGGLFDEKKAAETEWMKTRTEAEKAQMRNASDIPKLGIKNTRTGSVFKPGPGPTYFGPSVGLIGAR